MKKIMSKCLISNRKLAFLDQKLVSSNSTFTSEHSIRVTSSIAICVSHKKYSQGILSLMRCGSNRKLSFGISFEIVPLRCNTPVSAFLSLLKSDLENVFHNRIMHLVYFTLNLDTCVKQMTAKTR